ncbi:LOW QUALITY PROTEIN: protein Niban 2-like [Boleophthalmus pectinirostris]|uniref:LOW QUALITY PROTEIN: protein Niban 2-like n=1 Tax=Boleophthalmus pectinirostris TaxID=150288 RepID=UPI0024301C8C|nr:LOW QUALITY PROTEIN: protein Niban 2-like [Boleophthalmus pectinirostris]
MSDFSSIYEKQYSVALFNSVRAEIEGTGGTQAQLLHRKDPLAGKTIFSGSLLQYLEENRKWRTRYVSIPNSYTIDFYESKTVCDHGLQPKVSINCAGYKVLTSLEEYLELMDKSLPGVKAKASNSPFIKTVTQYTLILWHPYARHHYFCVLTDKEHSKWSAVLQDCVRHANNGLPEESTVLTPAFTNSVRLYRQAKGHYGSWDQMCGTPPQILANLVMEDLHPDLRSVIGPKLKGKLQQRLRSWMLISGAVYRQVLNQTTAQYESLSQDCEAQRGPLDAALRTDMDQIITSKEHVSSKIRALVLPKAEQVLRSSVQPYVSSILEALMVPTSRGFSEVREVFCRELVELSKNSVQQDKDKLGEQMERLSMLAFHPVKMRSCYDELERMELEGLQHRFSVSGPTVFRSRAQILLRGQMDNSVYTFEQLLNQSLQAPGDGDLCKSIQKCQERVLKKFDYDSSTVRKKFFREALLQIIVPYMLQQLAPSCAPELPRFQELIFEDFSRFLLVENLYEEVVIQSVSKDIMSAVKEAAVQRKHNLYRDSIVLTNSDPNLDLLGQDDTVDWRSKFLVQEQEEPSPSESADSPATAPQLRSAGRGSNSGNNRRQVVSMIQLEGVPLPYESCLEVPGVDLIPEEDDSLSSLEEEIKSPDSVNQIRDLINPVVQVVRPVSDGEEVTSGTESKTGLVVMEDGIKEEVTHVTTMLEKVPRSSIKIRNNGEIEEQKQASPISKTFPKIEEKLNLENVDTTPQIENFIESKTESKIESESESESKKSPHSLLQRLMGSKRQEEEAAIKSAIHELEIAVQDEEDSDSDLAPAQPLRLQASDYSSHDDSGFQSPTNERPESSGPRPVVNGQVELADVEVVLM